MMKMLQKLCWSFSLILMLFIACSNCLDVSSNPGTLDVDIFASGRFRRAVTNKVDTSKRGFTAEEKTNILNKHNEYRKMAGASDMIKLSWDSNLEKLAQSWADKCTWGHNPARKVPSGISVGENLHAKSPKYNEETSVKSWHKEIDDYTYSTNECVSGKMCGHYTQLVWYQSSKVGCAIKYCKSAKNLGWTDIYITVCNYSPAGNMKGQKPFSKGAACSKCPDGFNKCEDGLCIPGSQPKPTTAKPKPTTAKPKVTMKPNPTTAKPKVTMKPNPTTAKPKVTMKPSPVETMKPVVVESGAVSIMMSFLWQLACLLICVLML